MRCNDRWFPIPFAGALLTAMLSCSHVSGDQYNVPPDEAPGQIWEGDVLNLYDGGVIPNEFIAGGGSEVNIFGGVVGNSVETAGIVNIVGGSIGSSFTAFGPATISDGLIGNQFQSQGPLEITGGTFGDSAIVGGGDDYVPSIAGGTFGQFFQTFASQLDISGGMFGDFFDVAGGAVVNFVGGQFGSCTVSEDGGVSISGGKFGPIEASYFSHVDLLGTEFWLDGQPLSLAPDEPLTITQRDMRLEATLLDGSNFGLDLNTDPEVPGDYILPESIVTVTLVVPEPSALVMAGIAICSILALRGCPETGLKHVRWTSMSVEKADKRSAKPFS